MSYIGNQPSSVAFLTDTFSGNASATSFTLSAAPATTSSIIVAVSGVLQDPSTYAVTGTTLNFSAAPPSGTGNISVRFLGIPASGVTTTAYRTVTEFTATAAQTTFTPPSYTVGFINVYRNGVLLGSADYTATNGTTVVLATGATSGDLVTVESFNVSSVLNAIPASPASVDTIYLVDGAVTAAKLDTTGTANSSTYLRGDMAWSSLPSSGKVLQVVSSLSNSSATTSSSSFVTTGLSASITPSATSSKIAIFMTTGDTGTNEAGSGITLGIFRNGSQIGAKLSQRHCYVDTSATEVYIINQWSSCYIDSPSSTSSLTYSVQFNNSGAGTVTVMRDNTQGSLILMEIAA